MPDPADEDHPVVIEVARQSPCGATTPACELAPERLSTWSCLPGAGRSLWQAVAVRRFRCRPGGIRRRPSVFLGRPLG